MSLQMGKLRPGDGAKVPEVTERAGGWVGLGSSCSGLGWSLPTIQREPQCLVCKMGLPVHPIGENHGQGSFLCPPPKQSMSAEYFGSEPFLHTSGLFLVFLALGGVSWCSQHWLQPGPWIPNRGGVPSGPTTSLPWLMPQCWVPASFQHSGPVPRDFPSAGPWLEARGSPAGTLVLLTSTRASHGAPQGPPRGIGPTKWAMGGWQWCPWSSLLRQERGDPKVPRGVRQSGHRARRTPGAPSHLRLGRVGTEPWPISKAFRHLECLIFSRSLPDRVQFINRRNLSCGTSPGRGRPRD